MPNKMLIPCLKQLFAEFDRIAPSRDKASDGDIGNTAHSETISDHNPDETGNVPIHDADHENEIHAVDVDNNLRESDLTMEKVVQFLLGRCRSGKEKRLRYIIYNRRIWSVSSNWVQKTYTGASPHTEHAHFSASYTSALEASTASWHLEDIPVAMTEQDKADVKKIVQEELRSVSVSMGLRNSPNNLSDSEREKIAEAWLAEKFGNPVYASRTLRQHVNDLQALRDILMDPVAAGKLKLDVKSNLTKLIAAADIIISSAGSKNATSTK